MSTSLASVTVTILTAFIVLGVQALTSAHAWYDKGHRIVGLIAHANLTPEARKEIESILTRTITLADAAIWPDHAGRSIRDFDPLHYVRVPEIASGYDQATRLPRKKLHGRSSQMVFSGGWG